MKRLRQFFYFVRVMIAAREVQDFLWGGAPGKTARNESFAMWIGTMEKRLNKMRALDLTNPAWRVELKKRLLQLAAVAVAMIEWIDDGWGEDA